MGAQRPVTFLTHFRTPFHPSSSFPFHAGPEGTGAPEGRPPATPSRCGPGAPAVGLHGEPGGNGREPAPTHPTAPHPTPRLPVRGPSLVTWAREHLSATSAPGGAPPAAPGEAPSRRAGNTARSLFLFRTLLCSGRPGGGQGGSAGGGSKVQKLRGILPPPPPSPPPHPTAARARPQPASAGNLGSSRAPGGMLPSLGGGRRGEGRWRLVTGECVCFQPPSPGRGRKLPSQPQLLSERSHSATWRAPRPSPARPAGTGAALRLGAPAPRPRGPDLGAGERARGELGWRCGNGTAAVGWDWGCASPRPRLGNDPWSPRRARPQRPPPPGWAREAGAEDGGGALETAPRE